MKHVIIIQRTRKDTQRFPRLPSFLVSDTASPIIIIIILSFFYVAELTSTKSFFFFKPSDTKAYDIFFYCNRTV